MNKEVKFKYKFGFGLVLGFGLGLLTQSGCVWADAAPFYESRGDHYRTGVNMRETMLNTTTVNHQTFGLLFSLPVDDNIPTQTLYAPHLNISGYVHNVVFITTTGGSVYAYDADASGPPLWHVQLGTSSAIHGTPIIDPAAGILYVVEIINKSPRSFMLHAMNIFNGAEKLGGPVVIKASYTADGHTAVFPGPNSYHHAGLALSNGQLIIPMFGGEEADNLLYQGWMLSYNATTLQLNAALPTNLTPPSTGGGIWQSGRAPAVDDAGNVYLFTGNAYLSSKYNTASNGYDGVHNFSESLLKFSPTGALLDWFTPYNWALLDAKDLDLSSSGPIAVPGTNLLIGCGKEGVMYVWNTQNLGKLTPTDAHVVQKFTTGPNTYVYSGEILWMRTAAQGGPIMYNVFQNAPVYAYGVSKGLFNTTPLSATPSADYVNTDVYTTTTLSANGGIPATGVLWALHNNPANDVSILRAYDALNLSHELWNSSSYLSDSLGGSSTYIPPTISNGKVYTPSFNKQLVVYGLMPANVLPAMLATANQTSLLNKAVQYAIHAQDTDALSYSATGLPPGLQINAATGLISGTPTLAGTYNVKVMVTDNKPDGLRISTFTWKVS